MKKFTLLLILAAYFTFSFAGKLVQITYESDSEMKAFFKQKELTIHYAGEQFILATTENYNGDFTLVDDQAWSKGESYYIAWFWKGAENKYIEDVINIAEIIVQNNDYLLLKTDESNSIPPPTQGSVVRISNKEISLPSKNFTYTEGTLMYDPDIEAMMDAVDTELYIENVTHLQDYGTRNAYTAEAVEAQNWIKEQYESYGYTVELFDFSMPGGDASDNVLATKTGTKYPDEYVVIGGHYDSYAYGSTAPGADDDASGTCGVMEVARVMAEYETDRTVIFCAWSGEEYGLYGSEAWAEWAADEGLNILGYFNIDMCGYLHPGDEIHTDMIAPNSAQPLVDFYTDVCAMYLPDFIVEPGNLTGGDSDHTSFNNAGYMGIFPFEDSQNYSPYIHSGNDVVGTSVNSPEMAMYFIKAMIANVATMANFLAPPSNLMAMPGDESIELVWNEVYDIDNYNVYKDGSMVPVASPVEPYFLDEDVENFTTYTYYVTCVYSESGEESNPSNMVTVTPLPPMVFPFADDFEDGASYWNFESPWGLTTAQYNSASHSITESPSGSYGNNLETSATLYSFSLLNAESATLSFWTRYALETGYDYTWLEVSTNGTTWTELDEFNGNQSYWEQKEYSLDNFLGEPYVVVRFRFYSDVYVTDDGMYIDDLELNVVTSISGIEKPGMDRESISIQPNPFTASTSLELNCRKDGEVNVEILTATGKKVMSIERYCHSGPNRFEIDGSDLTGGVYYVVIHADGAVVTKKIILMQ